MTSNRLSTRQVALLRQLREVHQTGVQGDGIQRVGGWLVVDLDKAGKGQHVRRTLRALRDKGHIERLEPLGSVNRWSCKMVDLCRHCGMPLDK